MRLVIFDSFKKLTGRSQRMFTLVQVKSLSAIWNDLNSAGLTTGLWQVSRCYCSQCAGSASQTHRRRKLSWVWSNLQCDLRMNANVYYFRLFRVGKKCNFFLLSNQPENRCGYSTSSRSNCNIFSNLLTGILKPYNSRM